MSMSANESNPVHTVGDLIDKLQEFERSKPVRAVHALTGNDESCEWIKTVGLIPPSRENVGVIYMAPGTTT